MSNCEKCKEYEKVIKSLIKSLNNVIQDMDEELGINEKPYEKALEEST